MMDMSGRLVRVRQRRGVAPSRLGAYTACGGPARCTWVCAWLTMSQVRAEVEPALGQLLNVIWMEAKFAIRPGCILRSR